MFREIRKQDRKIETPEAIEILKKCEYGVLSMTGENGYAYGVPLSYAYMDDNIYFHCAKDGQKVDNIRTNDKVSFCVVGEAVPIPENFSTKYESVIVFGKAVEVSGEEMHRALLAILDKYSSEYIPAGIQYIKNSTSMPIVIKICVEHISGKASR